MWKEDFGRVDFFLSFAHLKVPVTLPQVQALGADSCSSFPEGGCERSNTSLRAVAVTRVPATFLSSSQLSIQLCILI